MTFMMPLADAEARCADCIEYEGRWCCTMNCSNVELASRSHFAEPEIVELRRCNDGYLRWHLSTRDGWQVNGCADGLTLMLKAAHFAEGARIELREPIATTSAKPETPEPT